MKKNWLPLLMTVLLFGGLAVGAGFGSNGPRVFPTNKVSRGGDTMTGALTFSGTGNSVLAVNADNATNPAYSFSGATNYGMYKCSGGVCFTSGGTQLLNINASVGTISAKNGALFSSEAASGNNAYQVTTNGARIDFGSGASDYASSDGTTVTFAGPLSGSTVNASTSLGINGTAMLFRGNSSAGSADMRGATSDTAGLYANGFGDSPTLTAGTDRYIAGFFNDSFSTARARVGSVGDFESLSATTAIIAASGAISNASGVGTSGNCLLSGGANAGTTWGVCDTSGAPAGATFSGDVSITAYPTNTDWSAFIPFVAGTTQKVCFTTEVVGTGTNGNTVLAAVYDRTGTANVCTLAVPCNSTDAPVGTVTCGTCGPAALASTRTYGMRWTTDNCTLRPSGDFNLSYTTP